MLKEYFSLFLLFFKSPKHILYGIYNSIIYNFLSKNDKAKINIRRYNCSQCIFNSKNYSDLGLYKTSRKDLHCSLCKCNIKFKTACLSCSCAIKEHNKKYKLNLTQRW